MKQLVSLVFSIVVLSTSQMVIAEVKQEKVTCTDCVSCYKTDAKVPQKAERVQRTDRVAFYPQQLEQPSLQKKPIARIDRVVLKKS